MKNVSSNVVSNLRLRAGWGQVGNQNAAGYHDYASLMTNGYTYVFGGVMVDGALQKTAANTLLSWETSEQTNVGVDFGLFGNKLSGSVDYFIRNTNDMILATPVPIYSGLWKPTTNTGSLTNRGVEISLNYSNSVNEDFSYNFGTNLAIIKNEVTSIGGSDPIEGGNIATVGNTTRTEVGHEIAYFYGLETDGIFNSQVEADSYTGSDGSKVQPYAEAGDVKFVDQNGDGVIDDSDRIKLGSAIPNLTMGFNAGFNYKWFDFNMSLQGSFGAEIIKGMYYTLYSSDMKEWNICSDMLNRWTPENSDSDLPRLTSSDPNGNTKFSDRFVEDGSYLRISNVQIGYTLPSRISEKLKVSRFRIYASTNNLYTFTNYSGYDPDTYSTPVGEVNIPDVTATGDDLIEAIWLERRLELAMENLRMWDLIRQGKYLETIDKVKDKDREGNGANEEIQYAGCMSNCKNHCLGDTHGAKVPVPVLALPPTEVSAWGLEQNPY